MNTSQKLAALRTVLAARNVEGFILPMADEYLSEYVPPSAQRLRWLSGFSGSAGTVMVLREKAALFVDGRYILQAAQEVESALFAVHNISDITPENWLKAEMKQSVSIGFDPRLHSTQGAEKFRNALQEIGASLTALIPNPVDALWEDRPPAPSAPAFVHKIHYAGQPAAEKIAHVCEALAAKKADAALITAPESVNWLLNIRGHDVEYTPVLQAMALVQAEGKVFLYTDPGRIPPQVRAHLGERVEVRAAEALAEDIQGLGWAEKRLLMDPAEAPYWFAQLASEAGAAIVSAPDPCLLLKACKTLPELEGIRRAHVVDGLAMVRFLAWLYGRMEAGAAISEAQVDTELLRFRAGGEGFLHPSFATIAGSGPNGAIVHYRASAASARMLRKDELFLLDSGGQYLFGTTDITRTLSFGIPASEQRMRFTQVLKGHIALATARFPHRTSGSQLDILARQYLWQAGLDYDHGTGHGVGYALSVHEGPQRISKRGSDISLKPGMVLSNEPGFYKAGEYGIRIENLIVVTQAQTSGFYEFETITCVPIDRMLIAPELMSAAEKDWLNQYHAWVEATLSAQLDEAARTWLHRACREIQ